MKKMKSYKCVLETVKAPIGEACMRCVLIMAPDIVSASAKFEQSAAFRSLVPMDTVKTLADHDSRNWVAYYNNMAKATCWMLTITISE